MLKRQLHGGTSENGGGNGYASGVCVSEKEHSAPETEHGR
jgi:hypothetical protein